MDTPETPEIRTPGFRIVKKALPHTPVQSCHDKQDSPSSQSSDLVSPELPTFETPYVRKLLSVKKVSLWAEATTRWHHIVFVILR